jgi:hypothetical protein
MLQDTILQQRQTAGASDTDTIILKKIKHYDSSHHINTLAYTR